MDEYMEQIRSSGRRLTRQRKLVLEILNDSQEHLDADMIYDRAKSVDPNIGLATVYRSLALLKEIGLVQEHRLGENHGHFEKTQPTPHHHFTCLKCGRVIEFEAPQVIEAAYKLCENEGLQVTEMHLHLSGYCSQCHEGKLNCE
ncbi:MAG: transcriptional repressor [Anaerolineae bacterium]|nr:transcriptional repressor [Anaerolineae bacterium]